MTRIEVFWPKGPEHAGTVGVRQVAWAAGIGEYVQKTIYVPLEEAGPLGASLLIAGRRGAAGRRGPARLRLVTARG